MKVVLDTNIIVSGLLWSGLPSQVLNLVEKHKIEPCFSIETITELEHTLKYEKFANILKINNINVNQFVTRLAKDFFILPQQPIINIIKNDPSDNIFLACAIGAKANCIVSGDKHLIKLKEFQNIPIFTAKDFLEKYC